MYVVNTAMRIMAARYPAEVVANPLPDVYDLRKIIPIPMDDHSKRPRQADFQPAGPPQPRT